MHQGGRRCRNKKNWGGGQITLAEEISWAITLVPIICPEMLYHIKY